MKINAKTVTGVGVGLLAGYFLFKNKNKKLLYIGGMALAGGILANFFLNRESSQKSTTPLKDIQESDDEVSDEELRVETQQVPIVNLNLEKVNLSKKFDIDLDYPQ
jgi:plastocyanin domain-containing protein